MKNLGSLSTFIGVAAFLVVVVLLNAIQPDYDPQYQLVSELALGPHGWAMVIAFGGLALATLGIPIALADFGAALGYRLLLCITASFFLAAGAFPLGKTFSLHILAIAAAFLLSVISMYFFPTQAGRASNFVPKLHSWGLAVSLTTCVALGHSLIPMGIGQRLAALCLLSWLIVVAWKVRRPIKHG